MYTYLNQKYGLKNLIVAHASAIIKAVNKYSEMDNDIGVFGRMLRNEIDEEFRFVQRQLRQTVAELLRVHLQAKYPLKTDDAISDLLSRRVKGSVFEEEWVDIIKYMYNEDDSLQLIVLVRDAIKAQEHAKQQQPQSSRRVKAQPTQPRGRIAYDDFVNILLEFQLRRHEDFLAHFRRLFRVQDSDKNGVLNEEQFRSLVATLDAGKSPDEVRHCLLSEGCLLMC